MPRINSAAELENLREDIKQKLGPDKPSIALCSGTACLASGCESVGEAFEDELGKQGLADEIAFKRTGCHGFCQRGPLVVIYPDETCYTQVKPEDVPEIVQSAKEKKRR